MAFGVSCCIGVGRGKVGGDLERGRLLGSSIWVAIIVAFLGAIAITFDSSPRDKSSKEDKASSFGGKKHTEKNSEIQSDINNNWFSNIVEIFKTYLQAHRANKSKETPQDRAARRTANATVWIAFFTAAVIVVGACQYYAIKGQLDEMRSGSVDTQNLVKATSDLAAAAKNQVAAMHGQLDVMKFNQRPWVGVDVIQNDALVEGGKPFRIVVAVKNFGHSPAFKVKGCFGSDTPNITQQDRNGILNLFNELACQDLAETVLMPDGEFSFDVSRSADIITNRVAYDINRKLATFAVVGRIYYTDSIGSEYWTTACSLYIRDSGHFNACKNGNDAR
jgi:hypothetical protein